jgi:serine/threonine-protein kinase
LPPPSWLNDQLDGRLEALIIRATRKHPDNRYASMDALLQDVETLLGLRLGEVSLPPLAHTPDAYEASTERGREAIAVLAEKFGPHASIRPSRA